MKNLLSACLIVMGVIWIAGFIAKDRLRLTAITQPFVLVVSMPDLDERYHTLYLLACQAEITESGVWCVDGGWQSTSTRPIQRPVENIPYLNLPSGTLMFAAVVWDARGTNLASDRLILFRAW